MDPVGVHPPNHVDSIFGARAEPSFVPQQGPSSRCQAAGGVCVGKGAIAANPGAPCPAGMHRVDHVPLLDGGAPTGPACLGIPFGEEACCLPNVTRE